jgi:hypothetical protein
MVLRGRVVETNLVDFAGRGDSLAFRAPDPHVFAGEIPLQSPAELLDLYALRFDEIVEYLGELGAQLDVRRNEHLQYARDVTYAISDRTRPLIDNDFAFAGRFFRTSRIREIADRTIGIRHLDGWVDTILADGTTSSVRAFGARTVHIIAGNGGLGVAADTIIRNAITRSDCIIKTPSNNPFAAVAIARTMCEMASDHPITKHVAAAYWRGGDDVLEQRLYQPHNVDKIVAWGGQASVKHVTRYIQPGLELISLDPKYSISVVGSEALRDDGAMREVALRIAIDVGGGNQAACSAARVVYVLTDGRPEGVARTNELGEKVYEELVGLPAAMSTAPKAYDPTLRVNVESLRLQDEWYKVIGGRDGEGSVIVSQLADPVDFTDLLRDRTVNIVPVDSLEEILPRIDSYTQTIGVFPDGLQHRLRDVAPLFGAQRLVPLGYASHFTWCGPHDGMEFERRLCKWIVSQHRKPGLLTFAASRSNEAVGASGFMPPTLDAVSVQSAQDALRDRTSAPGEQSEDVSAEDVSPIG